MKRFTLTDDHLKLLRRLNVNSYNGQPDIDRKRPFGNSNIECDVAEIVGIQEPDWESDKTWEPEDAKRIAELLNDTGTALQIVLATLSFEPGEYVCESWRRDWHKVD